MNRKEAIMRYLRSRLRSEKMINQLQKWDEKKTIRENAIQLGKDCVTTRIFARRYRLEFLTDRQGRRKDTYFKKRFKAMNCLRVHFSWSIDEIALAFKTSPQRVEQILQHGI